MALIDVVKWEVNTKELVHKFPSEDLRIGTQLLVYPGQTAFFVKGGKVMDMFDCGTHTIKTENIPLLNKLINIPFGGDSPFKAEVWFINQVAIMDTKWGTPTPIQLEDPKYNVIVPVRAFGQYGLKVEEPRIFLETLVGNMTTFSTEQVKQYFKGKMMSFFTNLISDKITKDCVSVLNINSHLIDMSEYVQNKLAPEFLKYGLGFDNFHIMSVNVPEDDPSFKKLKEAKELAAHVKIAGRDIYQMERTFDVMDKAATNESAVGGIMGVGMGVGAGLGMGNQMGTMAMQTLQMGAIPPPLPQTALYYVAANGQQQGPFDITTILAYIGNGQINSDTLVWKQGMSAWNRIAQLPEFANSFQSCPPPISPTI